MQTSERLTFRQKLTFLAHLFKAVTRDHHRELLPVLRGRLDAEAVVLDIGAHAGQFAKLFAGLCPRGRVYAFEPGGYARAILTRVVRLRSLDNVRVVPMGLSDADGEVDLAMPLKASGSIGFGLAHMGEADDGRPARHETVATTTLDAFVAANPLPRIDLIKADIEGWEVRFLRGGLASIARYRPALFLEVVGDHLRRAGSQPSEAWTLLSPIGYRAHRLTVDNTLVPVEGFDGDGDYLFLPERDHADSGAQAG